MEGSSVTFTCKGEKGATKWFSKELDQIVHTGNVFTITNVLEINQGYYECWGQTNLTEHFRALVLLDVEGI